MALFQKADAKALPESVPDHVAIIMDGNGRWAKRRFLPRTAGHRAGAENLKRVTSFSARSGVKYLTVYAFSQENWKRPEDEVLALMNLFIEFLEKYDPELKENNIRLRFQGERNSLPAHVVEAVAAAEERSLTRSGMQLILAFNYSGREEITAAARRMAMDVQAGNLVAEDISQDTVARYLYLPDVPDPDLIIRSSGEMRISNFLLWEAAYSEFWISDDLWPDFDETTLRRAFAAFALRDRRYGGIKK